MQLSYLITTYNKADVIEETLRSLQNQIGFKPEDVEFICVDDASTDATLQVLDGLAKADPRIQIVANDDNQGPAIRINQAAALARGAYLIPVDGDDYLPANASTYLLGLADAYKSPLVFGRSKRGAVAPDVDTDAAVEIAEDALAFCAKKQIVHMGFLVARKLWTKSGGADETIFIQDQSLPLQLSAAANRLVYASEVVYWLRPADEDNLSVNKTQQHHDRFLSCYNILTSTEGLSAAAKQALMRQIISALWKYRRDQSKLAFLSAAFVSYIANRWFGYQLSPARLERAKTAFLNLSGIRRKTGPQDGS